MTEDRDPTEPIEPPLEDEPEPPDTDPVPVEDQE